MSSRLPAPSDFPVELEAQPAPHRRFLEYVERHPEGLQPETFPLLDGPDEFVRAPLQPWPMFVGARRVKEMADVATAVCRLIKSLPERVFGNDPDLIAEFYGMDRDAAQVAASVLQHTGRPDAVLARGDFIETSSGMRCMELNVAGNIGGFEGAIWHDRYRRHPYLARYLAESGTRYQVTHTPYAMFTHLVEQASRRSPDPAEPVNTALVVAASLQPKEQWIRRVSETYREAAAAQGRTGRFFVCDAPELREQGGALWLGQDRVSVVVETYGGVLPLPVFAAWMAGAVDVQVGPPGRILGDKLNLALLSESAEAQSELFTPEERRVIERHIPWTRRVAEEFATFDGERIYLPDLLMAKRERLILKLGYSMQGSDVYIGRAVPEERWSGLVRQAVGEGTWVVQEFLESRPFLFQAPQGGCAPHDVVWGLFVFGDAYSGCFVRTMPRGSEGVINLARGASQTPLFEVEE